MSQIAAFDAIKYQDSEKLKMLLKQGYNLDTESEIDYNLEFNIDSFPHFVEMNIFSTTEDKFTPLAYAIIKKSYKLIIQILLRYGANVNTPITIGKMTPLHLACGFGLSFKIIQLLLKHAQML